VKEIFYPMATNNLSIVRTGASPYFSDHYLDREKELVNSLGASYYFEQFPDNRDLILISNTHFQPLDLSDKTCNQIKYIIHPNSGHENIPPSWLESWAIPLIKGNTIRAKAVAEYCLQCLFHYCGPLHFSNQWDKTRTWNRKRLSDLTLLILGYGHVGKHLSEVLESLGAHVTIYDPYTQHKTLPNKKVDGLILCAELSKTSKHMVNQDFMNLLSNDGVIINPARAELISQDQFNLFVRNYPKMSFYFDVHWNEPYQKSDSYIQRNNIFSTSHIAGVFNNLEQEMLLFIETELKRYLKSIGSSTK